jgi:LmbE family N-acetylglucosaminyl deacetylase
MRFIDFAASRESRRIDLLFPGWRRGETVAFLSPHDDDVVLGAGYLVQAVRAAGGVPLVVVFCRGDAGYSRVEAKRAIVRVRRAEAKAAYATLGVARADLEFLGVPDLSLMTYVDRRAIGRASLTDRLIRLLRKRRVTRAVFSSPNLENWDHTAVFDIGAYVAPQAGDPILADLGTPSPVLTYLTYAVWGDFAAGTAARNPRMKTDLLPAGLRADTGILAGDTEEAVVRRALSAFASQAAIMENTVARRRDARQGAGGWLELYRRVPLREPIDYAPYFAGLARMKRRGHGEKMRKARFRAKRRSR